MKQQINWYPIEVLISNIQKTDKNYKIKNALGKERLKESLKQFGLAGTVICNWTGKVGDVKKLMLVDGNSRLEQELEKGRKKIWVSVPEVKLSPSLFREMSAMIDAAAAGDVDYERINGDIGKTKDFYERYHLAIPKHLLDKMGSAKLKDYKKDKATKKANSTALKVTDDRNLNDILMVQLMYPRMKMEIFRSLESALVKKLGTKDIHATVFESLTLLVKMLKLKTK